MSRKGIVHLVPADYRGSYTSVAHVVLAVLFLLGLLHWCTCRVASRYARRLASRVRI